MVPLGRNSSPPESPQILSPRTPSPEAVKSTIRDLIGEETFTRVLVGGPFGREGQLYLTRQNPQFNSWDPGVDFFQIVTKRQALWENCNPWTTGLSQLFDSTQEELLFQQSSLTEDAKRVESAFLKLSPFERIAHEHLVDMRRGTATNRNLRESDWMAVLDALGRSGIAMEAELSGVSKRILGAV